MLGATSVRRRVMVVAIVVAVTIIAIDVAQFLLTVAFMGANRPMGPRLEAALLAWSYVSPRMWFMRLVFHFVGL